nr:hypothetical protein GCM10020093_035070 [Planobispora longispora]
MGLADVFFALRLPFDSPEALELSTRVAEEIALAAYDTSADLAAERGRHPPTTTRGPPRACSTPTTTAPRPPRGGPRSARRSPRPVCATR